MNPTATKINSAKDPVCGMTVDPERTDSVATVEGQAYYFCAEGCRETFVKHPKIYLEPKKKACGVGTWKDWKRQPAEKQ